MKIKLVVLAFLILPTLVVAQIPKAEVQLLDVELTEFCKEEAQKKTANKSSVACDSCTKEQNQVLEGLNSQLKDFSPLIMAQTPDPEAAKAATCKSIFDAAQAQTKPLIVELQDDQGNPWKIRFHFGHSRLFGSMRPTDVKLQSTQVTGTIRGFTFDERTSDKYFNPTKWTEFADAAKWLDEPSNTFTLSLENRKNAFYLTAYHPKLLKSHYEKKEMVNGQEQVTYTPVNPYQGLESGFPEDIAAIPDGQKGLMIQNTHLLMVWQIGYGRKFTIFDTPKAGKLTYIPRADVGIQTGKARAVYIEKNVSWEDHYDKYRIQGYNVDVGHRIEYQRGRVALFVDQKVIFSRIKHGFFDGTASYNLQQTPTTFGVTVDLITLGKRKAKKP